MREAVPVSDYPSRAALANDCHGFHRILLAGVPSELDDGDTFGSQSFPYCDRHLARREHGFTAAVLPGLGQREAAHDVAGAERETGIASKDQRWRLRAHSPVTEQESIRVAPSRIWPTRRPSHANCSR